MKNVRAKVECRDGFKFSVVANPWVHCTDPAEMRDRVKHWRDVELGFPSTPDELIASHASPGPSSQPVEIYDYVPLRTVKDLVRKHGGVLTTTRW